MSILTPSPLRPLCRCGQNHASRICDERRVLLGLLALPVLAPLAACNPESASSEAASLAPVEIGMDTSCELDGMLLADYPGPKGQIHYAGEPAPWFYCETWNSFLSLESRLKN